MRISFDLDDTLICYQKDVLYEPNKIPFFLKPWINEPLRLGTCQLMRKLAELQWEVWIYTTSYRSLFLIRLWLYCYGIRVAGVINQNVHNIYVNRDHYCPSPSKNPRYFGIDLHIDDSEGVKIEGEKHGFKVLLISPNDSNWTQKIIEKLADIQEKN